MCWRWKHQFNQVQVVGKSQNSYRKLQYITRTYRTKKKILMVSWHIGFAVIRITSALASSENYYLPNTNWPTFGHSISHIYYTI